MLSFAWNRARAFRIALPDAVRDRRATALIPSRPAPVASDPTPV